jgi:phosphoadenosine phosphosulfate reductase
VCSLCGKKAQRIGSDLRPVFPEERLLVEVMLGEPYKYKESSVWNAAGNYYYAEGKKINFTVSQTESMNAEYIRTLLKIFKLLIDRGIIKDSA